MSTNGKPRRPAVFSAGDPAVTVTDPVDAATTPFDAIATAGPAPDAGFRIPTSTGLQRGMRWGALFISAGVALTSLAAGLWFTNFVSVAIAREDWVGWAAAGLLTAMGLAVVMLAARELIGFFRLNRIHRLRDHAQAALRQNDKILARSTAGRVQALFSARPEMARGLRRHARHTRDILDASDILKLADREIVAPLDAQARQLVVGSAKRVAMVTTLSPIALLTVGFVVTENLSLLRKLANLYGGRPGFLGNLRLARLVANHIILSGGLALTDDLLHQFLGQGLVQRLSRRLGEGVFNGTLTARVGTAALEVCRPLPFLEAPAPRLRDIVAEVFKKDGAGKTPP